MTTARQLTHHTTYQNDFYKILGKVTRFGLSIFFFSRENKEKTSGRGEPFCSQVMVGLKLIIGLTAFFKSKNYSTNSRNQVLDPKYFMCPKMSRNVLKTNNKCAIG